MAPNHRENLAQHIHISSADDLSYSVSASSGINDTIQTIVTGRKCWKTMKGKGEVVWPPYLEGALVEGEPSHVYHPRSGICASYLRPGVAFILVVFYINTRTRSRAREVSARRVPHVPLVRPLPHAQQVHLGLHLQRDWEAKDTQASRLPSPTASRYGRGQAQYVHFAPTHT